MSKTEAHKEKVAPAKDFKVSFFGDETYLYSQLGLWFLLFGGCLTGFWGFGWVYRTTSLGFTVCVVSLGLALLSMQLILYFLVLCLWSGTVFSLDRRGLRDHASFCMVGYVLMDDIKRINVKDTLFGSFVMVRLKSESRALSKRSLLQKALSWWVLKLCPDTLVVPMGVLNVSRMNLETQFSHFAAVLREFTSVDRSYSSSSREGASINASRFKRDFDVPKSTRGSETFKDPEAADVELTMTGIAGPEPIEMDDEVSGVHQVTTLITEDGGVPEDTFIPPVAGPEMSEKSVVIQQVEALREYVAKKKIDARLCDAYSDYISNFAHWSINQDPRIPGQVSDVRTIANSGDYEEVAFQYKGEVFGFSLRRDIGPADMALLSLSYNDRVRVSLRVSVEIGAFEPERIEVYHRGAWEKLFLEFYSALLGENQDTETLLVNESTEIDITQLKQNFGIKRAGDDD